jgi:hypothetical protein
VESAGEGLGSVFRFALPVTAPVVAEVEIAQT